MVKFPFSSLLWNFQAPLFLRLCSLVGWDIPFKKTWLDKTSMWGSSRYPRRDYKMCICKKWTIKWTKAYSTDGLCMIQAITYRTKIYKKALSKKLAVSPSVSESVTNQKTDSSFFNLNLVQQKKKMVSASYITQSASCQLGWIVRSPER